MMPRAVHAAADGISTIIFMINDTDVFVAGLYYTPNIKGKGATAIWMRRGIGDSTRHTPLHTIG